MPTCLATVAALASMLACAAAPAQTPAAGGQDQYAQYLYPLAKPLPSPRITIDVAEAPEVRPWAEQAQKLAREWFPHLTQLLATEHYLPPRTVRLTFRKKIDAPAYSTRGEITISVPWVQAHPDDFGMVIHELTHVVQAYPDGGNKPGWLVEGIADYIRWWRYEPEARRTPIDPERASYRDSYRTTAAFLAWVVGRYNRGLVPLLDESLRARTYSDDLFEKATGRSLDDLWKQFVGTLPRRTAAPGA